MHWRYCYRKLYLSTHLAYCSYILQTITAPTPLANTTEHTIVMATVIITTTVAPEAPPPVPQSQAAEPEAPQPPTPEPPAPQGSVQPRIKITQFSGQQCDNNDFGTEIIEQTQCFQISGAITIKVRDFYPNECTPQATDCNLVTYTDANRQNRHRSNFAGFGNCLTVQVDSSVTLECGASWYR